MSNRLKISVQGGDVHRVLLPKGVDPKKLVQQVARHPDGFFRLRNKEEKREFYLKAHWVFELVVLMDQDDEQDEDYTLRFVQYLTGSDDQ